MVAFPYRWDDPENLLSNTALLDEMEAHPQWFSVPMSDLERRTKAAEMLADSYSPKWGVWRGGECLGVLFLSRMEVQLDAQFHFLFLDHNLVGKRDLLRRFLGYCFRELGFRRISTEVPEDADKLLRFYRKLGFRYEGELRASGLTPTAFLAAGAPGLRAIENAPAWVAKQGSRVEGAFWRDDHWIDKVRLRLTRPEWEQGIADASGTDRSSRRPDRGRTHWEGRGSEARDHDPPTAERPPTKPRQ